MSDERIYPCADCGKMLTKAEGGTVFTVCEECWDKHYRKPESPPDELAAAQKRIAELEALERSRDWAGTHAWVNSLREQVRVLEAEVARLRLAESWVKTQQHFEDVERDYYNGRNGVVWGDVLTARDPYYAARKAWEEAQ